METFLLFDRNLLSNLLVAINRAENLTNIYGIQHLLHYWLYFMELDQSFNTTLSKRSIQCESKKCRSSSETNFAISVIRVIIRSSTPHLLQSVQGNPLTSTYAALVHKLEIVNDDFASKCFKVLLPTDAENRRCRNLESNHSDILEQYRFPLPSILTQLST
ncbi:unnamed protein product [Clavelina lepadiformis]|uniref:Uncharacterized protein n=1 Tax=Clavelina lepadiformis TaxID=159417 RepID=A0ABP0G338_CLALP